MGAPDVSVIVPVYNVESYLAECLDSLVGQSHRNIEIICVDDGSTDSSPEMLERYAAQDGRIRVISQENSGVAHSRNVGLDAARGEFALFVDSDDYIRLDSCELLLGRARETEADIVVFGGKTFPTTHWADASFAGGDVVYRGKSIQALLYERGGRPLMCNKLYRRSVLEEHGLRFNEELKLGEDHAFQFMTFPLCKTIAFMKDCLYFYRGRPDSAVASRKDDYSEKIRLHFDVVKYVVDGWAERGYLVGHERELAEWACTFLYGDVLKADYDDRAAFSREYGEFFDSRFPHSVRESLSEPIREQIDRMRGIAEAAGERPLFTVLVESDDEDAGKEAVAGLQAIERQTEQRVETIVLARDGGSAFAKMARAHAARDVRMKVLEGVDAASAAKEARGEYVLCTVASVVYEETLFEHLLKMAEGREGGQRREIDVFVLKDAGEMLDVRDAFDVFQPDPRKPFEIDTTYSCADLQGRIFEFASVSLANKVIAAPLLKECAAKAEGAGRVGLCARVLAECKAAYATNLPAMTTCGLSFKDERAAASYARAFTAEADGALAFVEGLGPSRGADAVASLRLASCSMALTLLSSIRKRRQFEAAFDVLSAPLSALWADAEPYARRRWGQEKTARCRAVLTADASLAYELSMADSVERLGRLNRTNLLMVGDFAAQAAKLSADIEEFYGSISYRTGRAVTFVPRVCVNALKRILRR